jgi:hypothetical protein
MAFSRMDVVASLGALLAGRLRWPLFGTSAGFSKEIDPSSHAGDRDREVSQIDKRIAAWSDTAPRVCRFAVVSLMVHTLVSLFEFPIPTVAMKLENDSAVRIGLPVFEATG